MTWKRLNRKTILNTKFLKVHEDTIELPNGKVIDDYTVVEKPDYVMVVAIDESGDLLSIQEYKYAVDDTVYTLPGGHIDRGESPIEAGKRELLEEVGYTANDWQDLGAFYDYGSKDCHKAHLVRATNARKTAPTAHESTEIINLRVVPTSQVKEEVRASKWRSGMVLAALVVGGIYS